MKGSVTSSSFLLLAPILNKSTIFNSGVIVVTGENVSVVPKDSFLCSVSHIRVVELVLNSTALPRFPGSLAV